MKVWGVVGWKNSGKTTLVERLVTEFTARGLRVSTVKHAHHAARVDQRGSDSDRHRVAGAAEVMLATATQTVLMSRREDTARPDLEQLLRRLAPVDLVLVEGFKAEAHPKIEAHRSGGELPLVAASHPGVRAIATDEPGVEGDRPVFDLNDVSGIADFIAAELGL